MKTLIVVGHPNLEKSRINKAWTKTLLNELDSKNFKIHILSESVLDHNSFDLKKEQELIEQYDRIILQFPLYWYMVPGIMKEWMDTVWCEGWAYGENGNKMENKLIELAVSCGAPKSVFDSTVSLETYLNFLHGTAGFVNAKSGKIFAIYGTEGVLTDEELQENCKDYLKFILQNHD